LQGRTEAAKASLVRLRGSKCQVEEYIQSIQESLVKKRIKENEISQNNDSEEEEVKKKQSYGESFGRNWEKICTIFDDRCQFHQQITSNFFISKFF
jgi:hypothetical protein